MNSVLKIKDLDLCRKTLSSVDEKMSDIFHATPEEFKDLFSK